MSYDASGMLSDPLDPNALAPANATTPSSSPGAAWCWRIERPASSAPSCRSLPHDSCCATATARTTPSATPTGRYEPTSTTRACPASSSCPRPNPRPKITASGSIDAGDVPARVARASRIWVEGIHDAELIEKVWGADLRVEGVVVEQLEGADDLAERVRGFRPGDRRRLGILLDHLVDGSKESRIAAEIDDRNVRITGHPYVDIWQAVKPSVIGIDHWPEVPKGQPWKEGVISALGITATPASFWKHVLGKVTSWKDLETPLLGAVEELIDFVAPPEP